MIYIENLLSGLEELSSRDFQARVWFATGGPEVSSFSECVSQTFDDTGLSDAIESGSCPIELSPESFEALKDLDAAVSRVPQGLAPSALLDASAMKAVRRKSLLVLKILEQQYE